MSNKKRRTEQVAYEIKKLIVEQNLKPGDRLPNEVDVMDTLQVSKSTVRESMRMLDAEGLLTTKTGPKGGVFVNEVSESKVNMLVSNYFFFKEMDIEDMYQVRKVLEPELAASLAGNLTREQLKQLQEHVSLYISPPESKEEAREHHIAFIEFHRILANFSNNHLLVFIIRFIAQLLCDLTVNPKLYEAQNYNLWKTSVDNHIALLHALAAGDKSRSRDIMQRQMEHSRMIMRLHQVKFEHKFIEE